MQQQIKTRQTDTRSMSHDGIPL